MLQVSSYNIGYRLLEKKVITMSQTRALIMGTLAGLALTSLSPLAFAAADDIEREFDVQPGGHVDLRSDAGAVDVNTWDENRVRVRVRNTTGFDVEVEQNGNEILITADSECNGFFNFRGSSIGFALDVPREYNLSIDTGGGHIEIADITGAINADTSGGHIEIGNVLRGPVRADTSGGRISILDVEGDVEVDTSGGSITVGNVIGSVNADTSGGRITIGNVSGDIYADTSGGNIEVGEGGGRVVLDTSGGSIRAGWAMGPLSADTSGGNITLAGSASRIEADTSGGNITIDGSGGPIDADTSGGSIRIRGATGPVRADTAGGRIDVDLGDVNGSIGGSVDLETAGGDVTVRIPTTLGVTINANLEVSRRSRGDYRIYTDFPLTIQEDDDVILGRGDINGGGDRISLRTRNSDIHIVRIGN